MFKTGRVSRVDGGEEAVPDGDIYIYILGEPRCGRAIANAGEHSSLSKHKMNSSVSQRLKNLVFFFLIVLMIYESCELGLMCAELFISYCDVV